MPTREVYPNAPLRLVTAEFRFPLSAVLSGGDLLNRLAEALGSHLPIIEPVPGSSMQSGVGAPVAGPASFITFPVNGYRLLNRERTSAITVDPGRLVVETTKYEHWESFRDDLVRLALQCVGVEFEAVAGLDRVGLRYINEVRVPGSGGHVERWREYIAEALVATLGWAGLEVQAMQSVLQLRVGDDHELIFRIGALDGYSVGDRSPLRLPSPVGEGPYFLIDIDSFWTRTGILEEFDLEAALSLGDQLHAPIDELFERVISDRLRDAVLRRQP